MEQYKRDFIDFLLAREALKIGGDYTLKSKRLSPYFINMGDFSDGKSAAMLGDAYASVLLNSGKLPDVLFGPAYKGIPLAVSTSIALSRLGHNVGFAFDRKEAKNYGEASDAGAAAARIIGSKIKDSARIAILDDVLTTGGTKYEAVELLNSVANNLEFLCLVIAVDRQEVGIDDKSGVEEFTRQTGIKVIPIVTASEIYEHLSERPDIDKEGVKRMETYLKVYGIDSAIGGGKSLKQKIVSQARSIIPACDVDTLGKLDGLVRNSFDIEGLGGYKIGFELGLGYGLERVIETIRRHTDKPIIYDHQKAGTDIPKTGKNFARVCKSAGVDAVILFPMAGPETEMAWIYHALESGLKVIVGGIMTHERYLKEEGGFIEREKALEMYRIAAKAGINNFVGPGNKLDLFKLVKETIEAEGIEPVFYSPGFVAQGGRLEQASKVAGKSWHAIIGEGIYKAPDIRKAAEEYASAIR